VSPPIRCIGEEKSVARETIVVERKFSVIRVVNDRKKRQWKASKGGKLLLGV